MIKYKLVCKDCEITFDSWFSTSKEYEKLKKKKFLNCHICNSLNVEKTLMSPNILMSKKDVGIDTSSQKYKDIKKTINKYQDFIKKNFQYVGENFAYEARSIHYKDKKFSKGNLWHCYKGRYKRIERRGNRGRGNSLDKRKY